MYEYESKTWNKLYFMCILRFSSLCNHIDLNWTQRYATQLSTISLFWERITYYLIFIAVQSGDLVLNVECNALIVSWYIFGILSYDWDLLNLVVSYGYCFVSHFLMLFVLLNFIWSQWITPQQTVCLLDFLFWIEIFIALNHFSRQICKRFLYSFIIDMWFPVDLLS